MLARARSAWLARQVGVCSTGGRSLFNARSPKEANQLKVSEWKKERKVNCKIELVTHENYESPMVGRVLLPS